MINKYHIITFFGSPTCAPLHETIPIVTYTYPTEQDNFCSGSFVRCTCELTISEMLPFQPSSKLSHVGPMTIVLNLITSIIIAVACTVSEVMASTLLNLVYVVQSVWNCNKWVRVSNELGVSKVIARILASVEVWLGCN